MNLAIIIITCIELLLINTVYSLESCTNCAKRKYQLENSLPQQELRRLRIDLVKRHILSELGLKHPPKVNLQAVPNIVNDIIQVNQKKAKLFRRASQNDDEVERNTIYFPVKIIHSTSSGNLSPSVQFYFNINETKFSRISVISAYLWMYLDPQEPVNVKYIIYKIQPSTNGESYPQTVLADYVSPVYAGWYKNNITHVFSDWSNRHYILEISCEFCSYLPIKTEEDKRAFISMDTRVKKRVKRQKRDISYCTESSTYCCREKFIISFSEIGWNDWILQPESYEANYCRGLCTDNRDVPSYFIANGTNEYIKKMKVYHIITNMTMCCAPSQLSTQSLLILHENNTVAVNDIPNMTVDTCDCS
ncbi:inhibin beta B chain-like [Centruroides vittatus]|uniref:inhibin beta B chain-like n=1 Tax=Centruroides vittatus TaxID=120091 RepID=UPI00350FA062